ncbi:MAG: putative cytokinetic ring protein SteA [Actinomycetota bacterium]|nr:putative cytokinetic ring protein SteA [Actinomycetota bacterium]
MKIISRTKTSPAHAAVVTGVARFERDNLNTSRKLKSGEIAIIDHIDLDRAHAEALIDRGVRAVVNVSPSTSGRYPNLGPQILARAGITLIDQVGPSIWSKLRSGDKVRLEGGSIFRDEILVAEGTELDDTRIAVMLDTAQSGLSTQLESLAANAGEHLRREQAMLLEGVGVPRLRTKIRKRPVVVVSKTYDYRQDLRGLREYIKDYDAILIGAGAGADALLDAGYTPHLAVGALDDLSDKALKQSVEVVITSASGKVTAVERLEKAGADAQTFVGTGSDEDLALVLADTNDASVIVLAGGHRSLVEFLDRGPTDMSSTFLTRLRVGSKLVDAKSVGEFYNHRISAWPVLMLLMLGVLAVGVAIAVTPVGDSWFESIGTHIQDAINWIQGLFT